MIKAIKENPELFPHYHLLGWSRPEIRKRAARQLFEVRNVVKISLEEYLEDPNKLNLVCNGVISYSLGLSVKNGVHLFLYMKSIYNLGTQKHRKFLEAAARYQDIGCFGLTELLHGSNVKDLQTEAHYDHKNR